MSLEYGINFNTEKGREQAKKEIEKWRKEMQSHLDKNNLNIGLGSGKGGKGGVGKQKKELVGYRKEVRLLADEYKKLTLEEMKAGKGQPLIDKYRQLKTEAGGYGGTLHQVASAQERAERQTQRTTGELKKQSGAFNQLKSYAMNFLSVYAGIRMIKNIYRITGEMEMQLVSMQAILRSAEKGAALFEQMKELAVMSPFLLPDLVTYAKQLSAFSVPYEELFDTTKMLADVASGLGVSMERIIIAFGQVRSAAVLRGQELRQFTKAGIPLVDELAKKFTELRGEIVSTDEVFDLVSERRVSFKMIEEVFEDMTKAGGKFYNMQEKQAETLKGRVNNLKDSFTIMLMEFGQKADGILKGSVDVLKWVMKHYEEIGQIILTIVSAYGAYRASIIAVMTVHKLMNLQKYVKIWWSSRKAITAVKGATDALTASQAAYNTVASISGGIISVLVAAGTGLYFMYRNSTKYQRELNEAMNKGYSNYQLKKAMLDDVVDSLGKATHGTGEYRDIVGRLNREFGEFFTEQLSVADGYDKIAEAAKKAKVAMGTAAKAKTIDDLEAKIIEQSQAKIQKGIQKLKDSGMTQSEVEKYISLAKANAKQFSDFNNVVNSGLSLNTDATKGVHLIAMEMYEIEQRLEGMRGEVNSMFSDIPYDLRAKIKQIKDAEEAAKKVIEDTPYRDEGDREKDHNENHLKHLKEREDIYAKHNLLMTEEAQKVSDEIDRITGRSHSEWQKKITEEAGNIGYSFLELTDADQTYITYLNRIQDGYDETLGRLKKLGTPTTKDQQEAVKRLNKDLEDMDTLAKSLGVSFKEVTKEIETPKDTTQKELDAAYRLSNLQTKSEIDKKKLANQIEKEKNEILDDSLEKELERIEIEKDAQLLSIEETKQSMLEKKVGEARAEWESKDKDNKEKYFDSSKIELEENELNLINKLRDSANNKYARSEQELLDDLFEKYLNYAQKIEKIETDLSKKLDDLETARSKRGDDETDSAIKEAKDRAAKEISALAFEDLKSQKAWKVLFSDLENYTIKTLKDSLDKISKADTSDLDPADAKAVQQAIDKLKKHIGTKDPFYAISSGWQKMKDAMKKDDLNGATEALKLMETGIEDLMDTMNLLSGFTDSLFGAESDASFGFNAGLDILEANVSSGMGAVKLLMGDPSGIKDVVKGITGYINVFRKIRNRKHNKEIERQAEIVANLEEQYNNLADAMEKALGKDYYDNAKKQSENLKKQAESLQKMIDAENKKGKDTDKEKIKQLEQQRQDALKESVKVVEGALEKLTGTNLTSAAEDFAKSWIDAYVSFDDTTEAMQERFKDMMQDMVVNTFLAKIMEKSLKPVFDMIDNAWNKDGSLSIGKLVDIFNKGMDAVEGADESAAEFMRRLEERGFDIKGKDETNLTGIAKDVAGMSEDTALVLAGYLDSIRFRLFEYIDLMMSPEQRGTMSMLVESQNGMMNHLQAIEVNTKATADNTLRMADNIDRVVGVDGHRKSHGITVNT